MILKAKSIQHIRNSVTYVLKDEKLHIPLLSDGVDTSNVASIIGDFALFQNENVKNGFVSLVISPPNATELKMEAFHELLKSTLKELQLTNRQYFSVLHMNTANPHIHVLLNRVDYNNKTWNDHHVAWKCMDASKKVANELGLPSAHQIMQEQNKLRKSIRELLRDALGSSMNLTECLYNLNKNGIEVEFQPKKNGSIGSILTFQNARFKASEIDRSFTFELKENKIVASDKLKAKFGTKSHAIEDVEQKLKSELSLIFKEVQFKAESIEHLVCLIEDRGFNVSFSNVSNETAFLFSKEGLFISGMELHPFLKLTKMNGHLSISSELKVLFENNKNRKNGTRNQAIILKDMISQKEMRGHFQTEIGVFSNEMKQKLTSKHLEHNEAFTKRLKKRRYEIGLTVQLS